MQLKELLKFTVDQSASDLHLRVPNPPVLRIDGALMPQEDLPTLTAEDIETVFQSLLLLTQVDLPAAPVLHRYGAPVDLEPSDADLRHSDLP